VLELPERYYASFLDRLRAVTREEVNQAIARWWKPGSAVTVMTGTADAMLPRLADVDLGKIEVVAYDSY
jgi:hypothetical protein